MKRKILKFIRVGETVILEYKRRSESKSSEEEEIKIPKCSRNIHVETVNDETKKSSSEEEELGIRNCRRRSRVDNMNEEVKGWTSSSKQQ